MTKEVTLKQKLGGRKAFIHIILMVAITAVYVYHIYTKQATAQHFEIYCYSMVGLGISFSAGNGMEHIGKRGKA